MRQYVRYTPELALYEKQVAEILYMNYIKDYITKIEVSFDWQSSSIIYLDFREGVVYDRDVLELVIKQIESVEMLDDCAYVTLSYINKEWKIVDYICFTKYEIKRDV